MSNNSMKSIFATALLGTLLWLAPTRASAAEIVDGGVFFTADTLASANKSILELEQKSGHTVRFETFAAVPADKVETVSKMDAKQRETFFSSWVHDRAEATQSRGIVVLMCRQPSHLNVWVGKPIQQAGFGAAQAKTVKEAMLTSFRAKEYDKGLTNAVSLLSTTFSGLKAPASKSATQTPRDPKHAGQPTPATVRHVPAASVPGQHAPSHAHQAPLHANPASAWPGIITVLMLVVGGIFAVSMIRRMFGGGGHSQGGYGAPGGGYGGGGYGGGGGGGFMNGLAGGIFGAVAGNWLYNQFSDHSASAGEHHSPGNSLDSSDSSNGGGFDSGTGSSDTGFSGGTDFGGGDFGSGDSGGGGSDFDGGGDF